MTILRTPKTDGTAMCAHMFLVTILLDAQRHLSMIGQLRKLSSSAALCMRMLQRAALTVSLLHEGRCPSLNDSAYTWDTGTSFAAPHVAGVAAIYFSQRPDAVPGDFAASLIQASTKNAINSSLLTANTPNRLLLSHLEEAVVVAASGP